ncbi:ZN572 protein, partial [Motacilla alba]|nr:ZN572 protein [Motacilla alba]
PDSGKRFWTSSHFLVHEQIHTEERPFRCPTCRKGVNCNSTILTHQCIHIRERRYECPKYRKSFSRSSHLTQHQQRRH